MLDKQTMEQLKFDEKGLIPAIVVDGTTGQVLTLAYMNKESLDISVKEERTCFWSRSRQELWRKGETSGAVTKALGFSSYWIGESVAPGVPVMVPVENPRIRLILKSGNFGQEDFFGRALAMTEKRGED